MLFRIRNVLKKHPLISNMVLYAGLYGAGDISRQTIQGVESYDYHSALRMSLVGSCCLGPFNFKWYQFLDRKIPGASASMVVRKVVLDQLFAGSVGLVVFYVGTAILERKGNLTRELQHKFLHNYMVGCVFWPCAQTINFAFVPNSYRVSFVGCAAFFWTNILSYFKSKTYEENSSQ